MSNKTKSNIMLIITAVIWGSSFVAQKAGTVLEPFTYNGTRSIVGGLALIPVILFFAKRNQSKPDIRTEEEIATEKHYIIFGGICCGIALAVASSLQQFGLYFGSDAGKAGFITTLYIMIVPLLGLFIGKKVRPIIWVAVIMGAVGFYLLSVAGKGEGFKLETGDLFLLLCALAFSVHILVIDHFSPKCDGVRMSCVQFFTAGVICLICMAIFENPNWDAIVDCWLPILYCGVMSSGVAYTLQIVAQKHAEPAAASLILSLESVFAAISGAIILSERMTVYEIIGSGVIFAAVLLAQKPEKNPDKLK